MVFSSRKYLHPLLILAVLGICFPASAQSLIRGTILDKSSKEPIENVNVYIANSMVGASTNVEGKYSIKGIKSGRYKLIASSVGYYHQIKDIEIKNNQTKEINFRLSARSYELPTVSVIDEMDDEWLENYDRFTTEFLGESDNSDETEIVNPYIIDFSRNRQDNLIASTGEPLEIINHAMGYRIIYFLEQFEYDDIGSVRYSGYPVFEELIPADSLTRNEWKENRFKTYRGSFRHFIKAMCDSYLSKHPKYIDSANTDVIDPNEINNYSTILYIVPPWEKNSFEYRMSVQSDKLLSPGERPNELKLSFKDYLQVNFKTGFLTSLTSTLKLHADTVNIDRNGRYNDEFKIQRFGYWASQRIADMLPLDYTPPKHD